MTHAVAVRARGPSNVRWLRPARSAVIGAWLWIGLSACKRDVSISRPHIAADGRPQTCPDTPITDVMPGVPTRDTTRCSFADSVGQDRTQLSGTVLAEDPGNRSGLPMEGIEVTVHKAEGPGGSASGNALGHAVSDAQGHFNVSAILEPGDYELVAVAADGRPLGRARVMLAEGVTRRVENLRLLCRAHNRLEAERVYGRGDIRSCN